MRPNASAEFDWHFDLQHRIALSVEDQRRVAAQFTKRVGALIPKRRTG